MTEQLFKKILLFALFGVVVFFSLFHLKESPSVWYDEGLYVQAARNLAEHGQVGLMLEPGMISHLSQLTVSYPLIYPLALVFKIFGAGILPARLLMAITIFGLVIISYFFIKKIFSQGIALFSLALLSTFPPLYGNGKSVLGEVPGLFYFFLFLFFISLAKTASFKYQRTLILLASLSGGLATVTKPVFILLIPAVFLALIFKRSRLKLKIKEVIWGGIAFLAPIIIWLFFQFQATDSIYGIFSFYANPYGFTNLELVVGNNLKLFLIDVGPAYLLIMTLVWWSSIIVRWKNRLNIQFEELISLFFSFLITLAYLRTSGMYRYLFLAQIISLVYFPHALLLVTQPILKRRPFSNYYLPRCLILFTALLGIYQLLFNSWVADFYHSRKTAFWENYFSRLPSPETVFFYDTPEVAIFSRTDNYYQYLEPLERVVIGGEKLKIVKEGRPSKIIVETGKWQERQKLFSNYSLLQTVYKYSILGKSTTHE